MKDATETSPGRDSASRLDAAIDALLDGRAALASTSDVDNLELLATARLLHEALPRFHPRFGFEARLASRLLRRDDPTDVGRDGPGSSRATATLMVLPVGSDGSVELVARGAWRRRSLVAGGAIASGLSLAIPLAGAAFVAWRRSRPTEGIS